LTNATPAFVAWHPKLTNSPIWMRITLSEQRWPPPGGTQPVGGEGPALGYLYGETEDYYIVDYKTVDEFDFADAPGPYPTVLPNGARHYVVPGFSLGANLDFEANGQPDPAALGDDRNVLFPGVPYPPGDEDGIRVPPLIRGTNNCVNVSLTSGPAGGLLDAWVDFNGNGVWGDVAQEQVCASMALLPGPSSACFAVPTNAVLGTNFARFRLSSVGGLPPTGAFLDGEVEDHLVRICQRKLATNVVITNIVVTNVAGQQVIKLQWNAEAAIAYQVQEAVALSNAPITWSNLGLEVIGPANTLVTTNAPIFERYYRVKVPEVCP
jgi:hypothetical protein